jgi:serine/threonine-protein kinase RsbW
MTAAVAAREDWELPAEPESVTLVRGRVRAFAEEHGASPADVVDLTLAVTEAVTNSVIHAFIDREPGVVRVTISTAADELTVVVADNGRGMQPRADSPGLGLGLPTIGRLAAQVDMREAPGGGTELSMTFAAPGVRGPARGARADVREAELLDAVSRVAQGAWPGEGVERLVDLLVPDVADACAVDVIDAEGRPARFAGRIEGSEPLSRWLATLSPRVDAARSATRATLEDGRPHVSELTLDLISRLTSTPEDASTMAATGIRWWVVIPLRDHDRLLGLLHFGLLPARGRPSDEFVELLDALGGRAAIGLVHTQLMTDLRRARRRFERVLDVLAEAVIVRDAESRLVYANEAAGRLFGLQPGELRDLTGEEVFARAEPMTHPDGRPIDLDELPYRRLLAGQHAEPLLVRMGARWLLIKGSLLDEGERLVVSVIDDVTGARS